MVKPVTQEIPENKPSKTVINIASTRFNTKERVTRSHPEIVSDIPNNFLLENCEKTFGPKEIPSASPKNTAANKIPYAASPACKSSTKVLANPITAPAAKKAPSIPKIRPRMILEPLINEKPSQRELPIDDRANFLLGPDGISFKRQTVYAQNKKLIALIYKARSAADAGVLFPKAALIAPVNNASAENKIAAIGAVPYAARSDI